MLAIKALPGVLTHLRSLLLKPASPLLLLWALPLVMLAFSTDIEVIDDAYISYRYARNLVEGRGLVFNSGEYVEGFTNLLWTLMMAIPEALGLPIHLFAAFLGITFGLLALAGTWCICRRLGGSSWGAAVAVIVLALYPDFWLTAANGLEGGLFAFLLMCTAYLVFSGRPAYAGICGGLLFMTRPDSVLVIPICALYLLVTPENKFLPLRQRITSHLPALLTPWLALVVGVTLWRLAYYGAWVPNTITAKAVPLSALDFVTLGKNGGIGMLYCLGFLVSALPLTLGAVLALILERRRSAVWLCSAIVATQVPVLMANGGDWMPNYRLLSVYAPLLAVLLGMVLDRMAATITPSLGLPQQLTVRLCGGLALVAGCLFMLLNHDWEATPGIRVESSDPCYRTLANAAQPALLSTDKVSPEALGTFSYMNPNIYSYDLMGLTDYYVAHHGTVYYRQIGKASPAYTYYSVRPNLILVHSGFGHLSLLARASNGAYNNDYSTYSLQKMEPSDCARSAFLISIRKDDVARILPTFADLRPQLVTVPD